MESGKIIQADNWLEAVLAGGGDMIEPDPNPCKDCDGLGCFACPFESK